MLIFYFTGTGNSLYVAKQIGGNLISISNIDDSNKKIFEEEAIGFVFPCYSYEVPRLMSIFFKKHCFSAQYFFVIITYGNSLGNTLNEFDKLANKKNIKINYFNSVLTIDNFLPLYSIENQLKKEKKKKTEEQIAIIKNDILNRKNISLKKENIINKISKYCLKIFNLNNNPKIDKNFRINSNCNNCRICIKICPLNNIKEKEKIEYQHNCCFCLSCIHNCPQNAVHIKYERSKLRYRNPNIKIEELLNKRNQQ